jgi:hypothetical protein
MLMLFIIYFLPKSESCSHSHTLRNLSTLYGVVKLPTNKADAEVMVALYEAVRGGVGIVTAVSSLHLTLTVRAEYSYGNYYKN